MKNLAQLLREQLTSEQLVELWLLKATNETLAQSVAKVKESLARFEEDASDLGISYAGALTNDDTPTQRELEHALDNNHLTQIKEEENPNLRRSNFRYIEKQYNEIGKYTRYILANGGERIITDDELQDNPYLARQVAMSDAREEWDYEEYNRIKYTPLTPRPASKHQAQYEQCFIKIGTKLYGDVINLPLRILDTKQVDSDENWLAIYENKKEKRERIRKYISALRCELKKIPETKIKIININNKCISVI